MEDEIKTDTIVKWNDFIFNKIVDKYIAETSAAIINLFLKTTYDRNL